MTLNSDLFIKQESTQVPCEEAFQKEELLQSPEPVWAFPAGGLARKQISEPSQPGEGRVCQPGGGQSGGPLKARRRSVHFVFWVVQRSEQFKKTDRLSEIHLGSLTLASVQSKWW